MWVIALLQRAIEAILDAVVPPHERTARTKALDAATLPLSPTTHALLGEHITTLMDYKQPAVQDLIRSLKYDGSHKAATLAADVLADFLREEIADAHAFSSKKIVLVPIPLYKARARERGFNQIGIVLNALPRELVVGPVAHVRPALLVRSRATRPQTRLGRQERLHNVTGAFSTPAQDLHDTHIVLIDDVTTTGATLVHAMAPLKSAGARVTLLALARA